MTVHVPNRPDGDAVERDDRDAPPPVRKVPPKRSYTRRRAGSRTAPGQAAVELPAEPSEPRPSPGPQAAPTIVEAAAAVHREQARGSDSDVLPTMVEPSAFDASDDWEEASEVAAFVENMERERARRTPPSVAVRAPTPAEQAGPVQTMQAGLSAWGSRADEARAPVEGESEPSQRFETAGSSGIAKTKQLSPVELAVEVMVQRRASSPSAERIVPPHLAGLRRELIASKRAAASRSRWPLVLGIVGLVVFVFAVLLAWVLVG